MMLPSHMDTAMTTPVTGCLSQRSGNKYDEVEFDLVKMMSPQDSMEAFSTECCGGKLINASTDMVEL